MQYLIDTIYIFNLFFLGFQASRHKDWPQSLLFCSQTLLLDKTKFYFSCKTTRFSKCLGSVLFSDNWSGDHDVFTHGTVLPGPCSGHLAHLGMFWWDPVVSKVNLLWVMHLWTMFFLIYICLCVSEFVKYLRGFSRMCEVNIGLAK